MKVVFYLPGISLFESACYMVGLCVVMTITLSSYNGGRSGISKQTKAKTARYESSSSQEHVGRTLYASIFPSSVLYIQINFHWKLQQLACKPLELSNELIKLKLKSMRLRPTILSVTDNSVRKSSHFCVTINKNANEDGCSRPGKVASQQTGVIITYYFTVSPPSYFQIRCLVGLSL